MLTSVLSRKALAHRLISNDSQECLTLSKTEIHNHMTGPCYQAHLHAHYELKLQ